MLATKLDKSEFTALVDTQQVDELLVAISDQEDNGTWLQARKEDGGPSDLSIALLRRRVPSLPDDG
ncbi:hypothetical protein ACX0FC_19895, partial [Enterococcus faecium]